MLRGLRVLVVSVLVTATVLVGPAPPAGAVAVCTANAVFAYGPPGVGVVPGPVPVTGTLVLTCPVLSPDAGMWTLPFATAPAAPALESCLLGQGVVTLAGATGPPGPVGGAFTYAHGEAGLLAINGTVAWPGNVRTLVATGEWLPILLPGNCVAPTVTGATATGVAALV